MKKHLLAVALVFSLVGGVASLQAAEKKELTPEQKAEAKKKALEKYDANKDGKLDDAEKEAMKKDQAKKKKKQ